MKPLRATLSPALRLLAVAAFLAASGGVRADEYTDVAQLLRAGKLSDAQAKADAYLNGKPRDPQMRFLKGVIQTEGNKPQEAIATFTALTQEYPELPEPYNNLAVLYANQKQFDKARTALEMAIRTNPSYATAHENLGDVYAKLASQAYAKALQLDGSNAAVPPKLALIRELFAPAGGMQRVAARAPAAAPTPSAAPAAPPTPPAAAPAANAPAPAAATPPAASGAGEREVEAAVRAWASAWAAKDMKAYLAAYDKSFDPAGSQSRAAWEEDRRARIMGKSRISVGLGDIDVAVTGNKATARFRQDYAADSLKVSSRKTLELVRADGGWRIVRESTG